MHQDLRGIFHSGLLRKEYSANLYKFRAAKRRNQKGGMHKDNIRVLGFSVHKTEGCYIGCFQILRE